MFEFNLSPLQTRRDIALLAVIHRAVLDMGPQHFKQVFRRCTVSTTKPTRNRHGKQLATHRNCNFLEVLADSILGLTDVYNLLPECIVEATTLSNFQTLLQQMVKAAAAGGSPYWKDLLSPRRVLHSHPLKDWFGWAPPAIINHGCNANRGNEKTKKCMTAWLDFTSNNNK